MADEKTPYHERYKAAPPPDYMRYLTAPFEGYWKRQGNLAREGLAMAEDGAQRARGGDMSGYLGAVLGPLNYLTSPINALLPEEQATRDFGRSLGGSTGEALAASGLGLAAIAMPGPDVGKGAKFADEAAEGITAYHGSPQLPPQALTPDGVQTGWVFRDVDRGGLHYPAVSKSQMRAMNRSTDLEDWDEVEVPIRGMFATQNRVNNDFSEAASKRSGDLPLAVRVNGKIYLRDGHHRVVAAAASGKQTAKIRLVDVDRMAADGAGQADIADILKRYAIPFTLGAGGAAIVSGANMPPELAAQMGPEA